MKTMSLFRAVYVGVVLFAAVEAAKAATIVLTNADALGASSFNAALNWSNGQAPVGTNAYVVTNAFGLRTPTNFGNITFAGNSLALGDGTTGGTLTYKGTGATDVITITNLMLNLGQVGNGMGGSFTLAGDATIGAGGATFDYGGNARGIIVASPLGGVGGLRVINVGTGIGTVTLAATNTFSGAATVVTGILALANSSALLNSAGVIVSNNAKLRLTGNLAITGRTATIIGNGGDASGAGAMNSAGGTNTWTGPVVLGADQARLGTQTNCALIVSGAIDGGANNWGPAFRTEDMSGTVIVGGVNTYSGSTAVVVGRLKLGTADNRLPVGTTLTVGNAANVSGAIFDLGGFNQQLGGLADLGTTMSRLVTNSSATLSTLMLAPTGAVTYAGVIGGSVALLKSGAGTQTLSGASTYTGGTVVAQGTLSAITAASLGAGPVAIGSNGTLQVSPSANQIITAAISGNGALLKTGAANLQLQGSNSFSGNITVQGSLTAGALVFDGINATAGLPFVTNNGWITLATPYVGTNLVVGGLAGTGLVDTAFGATTGIRGLMVNQAGDSIYSGALRDAGARLLSLTKTGGGILTLSGANNLSGGVAVNGGTLALTASGSISNSTVTLGASGIFDVTAFGGGYTPPAGENIQGFGLVNGSVNAANSAPLILPGTRGTPGTLTLANDFIQSAAYTNYFDLTNNLAIGAGVNDLLMVNGDFDPDGASVFINPLAPLVSGTYRLVNYGSSVYTNFNTTVQGNVWRDTWTLDTSVSTQVNLIVSAGTNQSLVWSPQASADWDIKTSQNWTNTAAGTLDVYADGDTVLFDDSGAVSNVVTLNAQVKPAAVTVNSTNNYTFAGAGRISDGFTPVGLTKNGSGTMVVAVTNDYSADTTILGGTLQLGGANVIPDGAGKGNLLLNGTLDLAGFAETVSGLSGSGVLTNSGAMATFTFNNSALTGAFDGVISGPMNFTKTGTGTLYLAAASTYSGTTTISSALGSGIGAARIVIGTNNALPATTVLFRNNANLWLNGYTQELAGLISSASYSIYNGSANKGTLILNADANPTIGYLADAATGTNATFDLILKSRSGSNIIFTLDTASDFVGDTTINSNCVAAVNGANSLGIGSSTITLNGGILYANNAAAVFGTNKLFVLGAGGAYFHAGGNIVGLTINGKITGAESIRVNRDTAILAIGNTNNDYTGDTLIGAAGPGYWTNGTQTRLRVGASEVIPNGPGFGNVILVSTNGGQLDLNGMAETVNGLSGDGRVLNLAGTGLLRVGDADTSSTFDGRFENNLAVTKIGSGTLTLTGNSTNTGLMTVSAGTLALSASAGISNASGIVIATNAVLEVPTIGTFRLANFQSLEGSGLVTGSVSTTTGNKIVPGRAGAIGTLSLANDLNLSATTTNFFDLTNGDTTIGGGVNDLVSVAGLLEPSGAVVAVSIPVLPYANGTYRLFNYSGVKSSSFNPAMPGNTTRKTWAIDEATSGQVNFVVSGSLLGLKWNSQTSTNWDNNIGTNWLDIAGATNTTYLDGDSVLFDDSGAVTNTIGIIGTLKPGSITIISSSNYTITGGGKLSGTAGLVKDGTGLLILGGANNDFTGGVIISNGTLRAGGTGIVPLNNITIINSNATLNFDNGNASYTYSNSLAGSGTLLLTFTGATANNLYLTGISTSFTGTIQLTPNGIVGSKLNTSNLNLNAAAQIKVDSGAQLLVLGNATYPYPVQIVGIGNNENRGAIRLNTAALSGPISLTGSATIGPEGGTNIGPIATTTTGAQGLTLGTGASTGTGLFLGNISDGVGTLSLIVSNGTSSLFGTNTYSGGTTINAGALVANAISDTGASSIANSGRLTFGGGTLRYVGATDAVTARSVTNPGASIYDITNAPVSLTLAGPISGNGLITKNGAGVLRFASNTIFTTSAYTISGGTIIMDGCSYTSTAGGTGDLIGNTAGTSVTLFITNNVSYAKTENLQIGWVANATGIVNMSSGNVGVKNANIGATAGSRGVMLLSGGTFTAAVAQIGNGAGGVGAFYQTGGNATFSGEVDAGLATVGCYGFYQQTGGSLTNNNWIQVGRSSANGVIYLLGGNVSDNSAANGFVVANGATGVLYIAGSQINAAGRLGVGWAGTARGECTVAGGSAVTVGQLGVEFNQTGTTFAVLNLNGGVLAASNIYRQATGGYSVVNFNGGTFRALNSQTILGAGAGGVGALDNAFVYEGGAIIDSSNRSVVITQPLRAPTGSGVVSLPATGTLVGYAGAPYVQISGGGGTGATAIALFDYATGSVTGLVLTSAGTDYTSAPAVTLTGGGQTNVALGSATIGPNVSGGLTKLGSGALLLNAVNSYTGVTTVSAGYLFGTGSVISAVTVPSGATIGPYPSPSPAGTFTIASSLTVSNGATISAQLLGTNSGLRVTGDLNSSPTVNVLPVPLASVTATGTHVMVDYAGSFNGNLGDLVLAAVPNGGQGYLANNIANSSIDLVITNPGSGLKWTGLVDSNWKFGAPTNWISILTGGGVGFCPLDGVLFDDSAAGTRTVNLVDLFPVSSIVVSNSAADYTFNGGGISGSIGLTKNGSATLTISGSALTFTNTTTISAGTLKLDSPSVLFNSSMINASTVELAAASGSTWTAGITRAFSGGVFKKTGAGTVTFFNGTFNGSSLFSVEGGTLRNDGNGANWTNTGNNADLYIAAGATFDIRADPVNFNSLTGSGTVTNTWGNTAIELFTLGVNSGSATFNGVIQDSGRIAASEGNGSIGLLKVGTGTQTLAGVNNYMGNTTLDNGRLVYTADNPFIKGLVFGASGTSSNNSLLDMTAASLTATGLTDQVNSPVANVILIGTGKTLTINGNVNIGNNSGTNRFSVLNVIGGGSIVMTGTAYQVGTSAGSNFDIVTNDMSQLGSFSANLGAGGTLRVGNTSGASPTIPPWTTVMSLASNSMITAGTLGVGDNCGQGGLMHVLYLGGQSNVINANTINIGLATGQRSSGQMLFNTTSGNLVIRGAGGTANRAVVNVLNHTSGTGTFTTGLLDTTGHNADMLISTLIIDSRIGNSALGDSGTLNFNSGIFDVTSVIMARRNSTTAGGTSSGTLNIGGGIVTIGTGGVAMANCVLGGSTANATLNLTGGVVTVSGPIYRVGGLGTNNATVTLNGASLDMLGNTIGGPAASNSINNLNLQAGTLANVGQINNGGAWAKTGAGTLVIAGANGITGTGYVSNGTLLVNGSISGVGGITVNAGTLGGNGSIAGSVNENAGNVAPGASAGKLTVLADFIQIGGTLDIEIAGTNAVTQYDVLDVGNQAVLIGALSVTTNGYAPAAGDSFTVLTASNGVFGTFGTTTLPPLSSSNMGWQVSYMPTSAPTMVILSVTSAPTGYDAWAAQIVGTNTAYNQSATGDGYPNLLKYATGSSPTTPDNLANMSAARLDGILQLLFNHDTNATDISLIVEGAYTSTNDATWNGIATNIAGSWGSATNVVENTATNPASVTVSDTAGPSTNRFLRLRVTRP